MAMHLCFTLVVLVHSWLYYIESYYIAPRLWFPYLLYYVIFSSPESFVDLRFISSKTDFSPFFWKVQSGFWLCLVPSMAVQAWLVQALSHTSEIWVFRKNAFSVVGFFFFPPMKPLVVVNISFEFWIVSALIGLRLLLLGGCDCSPCYNFCYLKFLYRNSLGSTHWRDFSSVSLIFCGWWILTAITDSQPKKTPLQKECKMRGGWSVYQTLI